MIILNEQKFAEELYCGRNKEIKRAYEKIKYVTRYQLHALNYSDEENYSETVKWMNKNHKPFEEYLYSNMINTFIAKAHKTPFYYIDSINIYEDELRKISEVNEIKSEKILFTLLCMAKFQREICGFSDGLVSYGLDKLFKDSRVCVKSIMREFLMHDILDTGLISLPVKVDTNCLLVNFISEEGKPILKLNEAQCKELPYEYLNWKNGGGYCRCIGCGKLFKKKANNTRYCLECSERENIENIVVKCVDCGKMFLTNSKDTATCRCSECQTKHRYDPIETKIVKCIDCGKEFEVSSKDTQTIRCSECQSKHRYDPIETKIIKCIDCGKEFKVSAKDTQTIRCSECRNEFIKKYDRERKRIARCK